MYHQFNSNEQGLITVGLLIYILENISLLNTEITEFENRFEITIVEFIFQLRP